MAALCNFWGRFQCYQNESIGAQPPVGASSIKPALEKLEDRSCPSVTLAFNYSLDTSGFFNDPQRRAVLEQAGQLIGSQLNDSLLAITPGGANSWSAAITHPSTGSTQVLNNLQIPADTLLIFVGGRNFGGVQLGVGGYGSYRAVGSGGWLQTVAARGQTGAMSSVPTDFGPWGGSLTFDTATSWFFGGTGTTPPAGQQDFLSVAVHELGHLLGLGTAPSWDAKVFGGQFVGSASQAAAGGLVFLDGNGSHWARGTQTSGQEASLTPSLTVGERKLYSALDFAGLQDVGWQVGVAAVASATPPTTATQPTPPAQAVATLPVAPTSDTAPTSTLPVGQTSVPSGGDTAGVFNPFTGTWYLRNANSSGHPDAGLFQFGGPGWLPVVGDWNGNGQTGIGVFNPTTGLWFVRNTPTGGFPDVTPFSFGAPGWIPVAGDWNGDGQVGIGVFNPATGMWYLRNSATAGAPDLAPFAFGGAGWLPVAGDWNGDGVDTIGAFDPSTGLWFLRNSNSSGFPDVTPFLYGGPGWKPVAGDWNGDGVDTIGAFDPRTGMWYLRNANSGGAPDAGMFHYGGFGWTPVGGNWQGGSQAALDATQVFSTDLSQASLLAADPLDPEDETSTLSSTHFGSRFCCCAACQGGVAGQDSLTQEQDETSALNPLDAVFVGVDG